MQTNLSIYTCIALLRALLLGIRGEVKAKKL